jgi:hypothetical protein
MVHLPGPKPSSAATVLQAFTAKLRSIAQPMRQSLTYDLVDVNYPGRSATTILAVGSGE